MIKPLEVFVETFVTLLIISLWAFVLGTGAWVGEKYFEDKKDDLL